MSGDFKKTIRFPEEEHEKIKEYARELGLDIKEYALFCCMYCIKNKINPQNELTLEKLRDVFVSFFRTQEKNYGKEFNEIKTMLNVISHDVRVVKAKK